MHRVRMGSETVIQTTAMLEKQRRGIIDWSLKFQYGTFANHLCITGLIATKFKRPSKREEQHRKEAWPGAARRVISNLKGGTAWHKETCCETCENGCRSSQGSEWMEKLQCQAAKHLVLRNHGVQILYQELVQGSTMHSRMSQKTEITKCAEGPTLGGFRSHTLRGKVGSLVNSRRKSSQWRVGVAQQTQVRCSCARFRHSMVTGFNVQN